MGSHLAIVDLITNLEVDNRFCAYLIENRKENILAKLNVQNYNPLTI